MEDEASLRNKIDGGQRLFLEENTPILLKLAPLMRFVVEKGPPRERGGGMIAPQASVQIRFQYEF